MVVTFLKSENFGLLGSAMLLFLVHIVG
jgi:hypothetical protein